MMRVTNRERWLAVAVVTFILIYGFYMLAVSPALERTKTLKRIIPEKQQVLVDIKSKSARYVSLNNKLKNLRQGVDGVGQKIELLALLESMTTENGLTKKVVSMKQYTSQVHPDYSRIIVEMKLQNINLQQLIDFLCAVKSSNHPLWINSLHTKKTYSDNGSLEATIQVSSLTAQTY